MVDVNNLARRITERLAHDWPHGYRHEEHFPLAVALVADMLRVPLEEQGWQPMGSAPKDGTRVLIVLQGVDRAVVAFWDGATWSTVDGNDWEGRAVTHWRPLPDPPEQGK